VSNPQDAIAQILDWTGGQPFLTQKLCKLMVEESALENSPSVEQVVKSRIIENWESQDEPEHLRTIRDRILRNEQKAGQLLGLYQQILLPPNPPYQGGENLKPSFISYALLASFLTIGKAQAVRLSSQALDSSSQTGV
jgi:hypothetical protein